MSQPIVPVNLENRPATEYSVIEVENPNSVINLVSSIPSLMDAVCRVKDLHPDLLDLDFYEIKNKAKPTLTLSRLRQSFWNEYENAVAANRKMRLSQIIAGVCTETFLRNKVLPENEKMAFILSPPSDYLVVVKEALNAGLDTLRQIVSANVIKADGSLDTKAADTIIKAVALLDMRVKGAIVQRVDQRTLNMNINQELPKGKTALPTSVEDLDRELDEVKKKLLTSVTKVSMPARAEKLEAKMQTLDIKPLKFGAISGE